MMDRSFLLLIEVTGEKEMSPHKISQKEERKSVVTYIFLVPLVALHLLV
jgi:hypothetical protein